MPTLDDARATRARRDQITALLAAGGLDACRDLVLDDIGVGPDGITWCTALARAVMDAGDLRTAAELADLLARVRWGSTRRPARRANGRAVPPTPAPARPLLCAGVLRHDADQLALLRRRGLVGPEFDPVIADYRALADRLPAHGHHVVEDDTRDRAARVAHVHGRIVHVADAPRVPQALSTTWRPDGVDKQYGDRGVVVIDDFLSTGACEGLLRFCQESTVWRGTRAADARMVSAFFDGLACPLLVQLAEEVEAALPRVVGSRRLEQVFAVKDAPSRPADTRADALSASLDLTVWITPAAANLDPGSGGLVVDGPPTTVVPYRANRAVLVGPRVVHRSDAVRFSSDYEHRRLAITLRYRCRDVR